MGKMIKTISEDGTAFAIALDAKDLVSEIEQIHQTSAVMTAALGRLAIAAAMMGNALKGEKDSLTLRVKGDGPGGLLLAVSDGSGHVKADVQNPVVEIPLNSVGKLDVAGAVGKNGTLSVSKDLGLKEPYIGMVPLVSGEIAEDIASYYAVSEQTPTVCGLGVLVNPDLSVRVAGGFLIQLLPFAPESTIETIEKHIQSLPPVTKLLEDGMTAEELALLVLEGLNPNILDQSEAVYHCDCSRERTDRAMISLGKEELEKLAEEQPATVVQCHFCGKTYSYSSQELCSLIKN